MTVISEQLVAAIVRAVEARAEEYRAAATVAVIEHGDHSVISIRPTGGEAASLTVYVHMASGALSGDFGVDSRLKQELEDDPPEAIARVAESLFCGDVEEWLDYDGDRVARSEGRVGHWDTKHIFVACGTRS